MVLQSIVGRPVIHSGTSGGKVSIAVIAITCVSRGNVNLLAATRAALLQKEATAQDVEATGDAFISSPQLPVAGDIVGELFACGGCRLLRLCWFRGCGLGGRFARACLRRRGRLHVPGVSGELLPVFAAEVRSGARPALLSLLVTLPTVSGGGGNRTRSLIRLLILGRIERKFLMLPLLRQNVFSRKGFRIARGIWSCTRQPARTLAVHLR